MTDEHMILSENIKNLEIKVEKLIEAFYAFEKRICVTLENHTLRIEALEQKEPHQFDQKKYNMDLIFRIIMSSISMLSITIAIVALLRR